MPLQKDAYGGGGVYRVSGFYYTDYGVCRGRGVRITCLRLEGTISITYIRRRVTGLVDVTNVW